MKSIKFNKELPNPNGQRLFTGKDKEDLYLFYGVGPNRLLGVKVSEKDLVLIESGTKDVSGIFTHPKNKLFYPCSISQKGNKIQLHFLSTKDLIKEFLCPGKGLFVEG
jgi:hypothetical protein